VDPDTSTAGVPGREIVVVPHTHWDREWYLPFQRFRIGLVRMLDEVLDAMAADPLYRFTMDGQLAAVEDYLEIRPSRRGDITRFVAEGRLAAGPWLILADEFLCSGETLLRNLEYGMRGAADLGGAMRVGYLPDQFGHCAQMPQMLALAGLDRACLWRGVPAHVDRDSFAWTGADGTTIETRCLPGGYGNAVALFTGPPEGLPDRLAAFTSLMEGWAAAGEPLLAMYGADHSAPARDITGTGLRLATLEEFLTGTGLRDDHGTGLRDDHGAGLGDRRGDGFQPGLRDGLPVAEGELRSHARANILPGVISARVPLKQAMARAERVIARYAEPLSALWLADSSAAAPMLDMAWRRVIACSGHDSITGCGSDETAQQVAARIAEAEQMGQAVVDLVSATLAAQAPKGSLVVVNPSPFERTGLVLADLAEGRTRLVGADGRAVPIQRLEHAPTLLDETVMDDLSRLLGRIHERELFGHEIVSWAAEDGVFTITVSRHASASFAYEDLRRDILAAGPGPWVVRTLAEPVVTVAALVTVPPLGRSVLTARAPVFDGSPPCGTGFTAALLDQDLDPDVDEGVLDNGLLRVRVAPDGTLSLRGRDGTEVHGVGRIVHGGDVGDTYNYAPPPDDRLLDVPSSVSVEEVHLGPLAGVLEITRTYEWPAGDTTVLTRVELRTGEPYARCELEMDVRCRDHRVRWHAPLPRPAAESFAEGQFAVVRRGLTAEGGGGERPIPTFPAESFVSAGGLAVLLDHVTEYELLPGAGHQTAQEGGAGEIALTLVRSVGFLSRNRNPYRDEPAGPELATPAAQCQGPLTVRFAVLPHAGEWHEAGLPRLAEEYRHALVAVPGCGPAANGPAAWGVPDPGAGLSTKPGNGTVPRGESTSGTGPSAASVNGAAAPRAESAGDLARGLSVSGDGVVMAALRERDGWLEVRLVAEHPTATEAVVRGGFTTARTADGLGFPIAPLEVVEETLRLPLRPFQIATIHLA
jgi:alpha-mannosidase